MDLQSINQISKKYGISMRMLRYYEQAGLITSIRKADNAYRFYDETAVKQLSFIILLRKLRISVKQIKEILNNQNALTALEIFDHNINELDEEITSLSTIKSILARFAEELRAKADMVLQLDLLSDTITLSIINTISFSKNHINNIKENLSMENLNKAEEQLNKLSDVRVIYVPPMTVAGSYETGEGCEERALKALHKFVLENGMLKIKPDIRRFGFHRSDEETGGLDGHEMWVSIPDDMDIPAPLIKRKFHGGLYAAHDIKRGDWDGWKRLSKWVDTNGEYVNDYDSIRCEPFEKNMSPCLEETLNFFNNIQKELFGEGTQVDLLWPIKEKASIV